MWTQTGRHRPFYTHVQDRVVRHSRRIGPFPAGFASSHIAGSAVPAVKEISNWSRYLFILMNSLYCGQWSDGSKPISYSVVLSIPIMSRTPGSQATALQCSFDALAAWSYSDIALILPLSLFLQPRYVRSAGAPSVKDVPISQ